MSKKLIAAAAAAALALTGLVAATPASAVGPFAVAYAGYYDADVTTNTGATATLALQTNVPSADVLRMGLAASATTGTLIRLDVTTPGATDAITVTTTGGVKVISEAQFDLGTATTATGVSSLTVAAASGDANIYAYTTSTTAGTVVVSAAGSSKTTFIKGLSTFAYKMNFTTSSSAAIDGEVDLVGTIQDAFGNNLSTALGASDLTITLVGGSATANATSVAAGDFDYNTTTKVYTVTAAVRDDAGSQAINLAVDADKAATKVTALGTPVTSQFFTVSAVDLATQVAALTAQVAALTADYNKLAARWNKKVDNKRTLKKKVALK